ncbi:hypothetical protein ABT288_15210 [Streptomyces sp. NPDC001093]|uniref:hypothetical protein n=1 Tax=Streptomyces sp. NPDC001093 TaxID=3154376 RepID=UPI00333161E4
MCTNWAAGVVQQALITEREGYHRHDRVEISSGALAGHRGYVVEAGWFFDDETETVEGPAGYVIDLDDVRGTEPVDADAVTACTDLQWPDRIEGTLKAGPPPTPRDPARPLRSCAEDLAELLDRAANPEIVPESLRTTIAAAHQHHHLELDWQASPSPNRFTWRVLRHWYQLTEHYADDQRADLFEVVLTRHLRDPEPVHYLALHEADLPNLITRWTTSP